MPARPKRVLLLGLDSVIPRFARKYMGTGHMPHLKRMVASGAFTDMTATLPPWTPPGWATIGTGAWPSTHGVEGLGVHYEGEPLTKETDGFLSSVRKAQTFWEAAEAQGKQAIIFKWPGLWPHRSKTAIQVLGLAGYAGRKSALDIHHCRCFATDAEAPLHADPVALQPASGWKGLTGDGARMTTLTITPLAGGTPKTFEVALTRTAQGPRAILSRTKDASQAIATLAVGQWSDWIIDTWVVGGQPVQGGTKAKLLQLSEDLQTFRLFFGQNHPMSGFSTPAGVDEALCKAVGPVCEYSEAYYELFWGWVSHDTLVQIWEEHITWMSKSLEFLSASYPWDIFAAQCHLIDTVQHTYWGAIDPGHPQFDPQQARGFEEIVAHGYHLVDRLIGKASEIAGQDTLLVVCGDHGHEPRRYTFSINTWLQSQGWLNVLKDASGQLAIDWSRTKAYAMGPVHIFLNVKGRDPEGIVEPGDEYERLRTEIIDALFAIRHDLTGRHIMQSAFKREEMDAFGLYGGGVGDIIYMVRHGHGYDCGGSMRGLSLGKNTGIKEGGELISPTQVFKELTSQHCSAVGWALQNRTWAAFRGPGIRAGATRRVPIRIVDVCPTICYLMGYPYPDKNEGGPVVDLLES
jgi:predicted AlkP superfamily phosphohydrolase/phosphomutase